ncbi:metallophosphoesterase [Aerophototrophica crusticola]|uniref:Metallophosphoesterase n=1 Tax=Aerophototrophica crusticola TaxID=1709002 RepID=A0A858R5U7_9PROT|nr:metallophosphoesterase [Rhodospirillaceae bacterium B3]
MRVIGSGLAAAVGVSFLAVTPAAASPGDLLSSYVLWGPGGQAIGRIVLDGTGQACPSLASGTAMAARTNPNPATFPITVCEVLVPADAPSAVLVNGQTVPLPVPKQKPGNVAVLGDSGCNTAKKQDCADPAQWPWPTLVQAAAAKNPDLVIHAGDYNYRGTPNQIQVNGQTQWTYDGCLQTPPISQNQPGSSLPDNWADWKADFFDPAAPLLAKAPWVFVRGNHELCSRAGPGYFYLLDARSNLLGPGQGEQSCAAPTPVPDITPTYKISLKSLSLVMLDSANACDSNNPPTMPMDPAVTAAYGPVMQALPGFFADGPAWFMTHRPILAVFSSNPSTGTGTVPVTATGTGGATLQAGLGSNPTLPANAAVTFSSHMHLFHTVTPSQPALPPQIVIGNSGVILQTVATPQTFTTTLLGQTMSGNTTAAFGWLWIDKLTDSANWSGTLLGTQGQALGTCALPVKDGSVCAVH